MSLQTSGQISLYDIQREFGGSNPIGINEYYGSNGYSPSSGTISLADFYGKTGFNYYSYIFGLDSGQHSGFTHTLTGPLISTRYGIAENLTFYVQCIAATGGTSTLYYYNDDSLLATFVSPYAAYWLFSPSIRGRPVQFESVIYNPSSYSTGTCRVDWDTAQYAPSYRALYIHDHYTVYPD